MLSPAMSEIMVTHAERDRTAPRCRLTTMPGEMDLSDTEIVQGQPSDGELFREALDTPTLKDFENPRIPVEPPQQKAEAPQEPSSRQRDEQGRFQKAEKGPEDAQPDRDGNIPS